MIAFILRQRLTIPTVLVRAIGVHAALFLLLVLVVGCGGQSSTNSSAPEPDPKSEPTPESGPNKREVAIEEGSLRGLVQERVGDFELQVAEEVPLEPSDREQGVVERLGAVYVGPGGAVLRCNLGMMRSPETANNLRQQFKDEALSKGGRGKLVDERPVEASGRQVGTLTVMSTVESSKEPATVVIWNNGNLLVRVSNFGEESDVAESFYESVPY